MRIYTVSDLHVDYPENMHWALSLSEVDYLNDILLIAGDLSHHLSNLKRDELVDRIKEISDFKISSYVSSVLIKV